MELIATVPIELGEGERFGPDLAKKLVGQKTTDGWLVISAKSDGPQRIWLTLEKGE